MMELKIELANEMFPFKSNAQTIFPSTIGIVSEQNFPSRILINPIKILSEASYELEEDGTVSLEEDGTASLRE